MFSLQYKSDIFLYFWFLQIGKEDLELKWDAYLQKDSLYVSERFVKIN